jgi:DNA end-binding protein Ku
MTLHTMFYSNEIRAAESVPTDKVEVKDQEKKLAQQLIESLAAPFDPQKYRDEYQENLKAMIAAKLKGQQVTEVAQPHLAPVIDLMEALKKSLAEKQAPAAAAAPAQAAALSSAEAAPAPAGKKPPARAVQPISVPQKRAGKKVAG